MKVSVIMPVYNSELYLRESIESVLRQTLEQFELICVDDGSRDSSKEIVREYAKKDDRVKLVEGAHKGGGAARNVGITYASGEYLTFLDSDDIMEPTLLEKVYEKCKEDYADIGIFEVKFLHQATGAVTLETCGLRKENLPEKAVFTYEDMPAYIFNSFHNWPWNKMFRRSFVKEHGIEFQEIMRTNDLLFTNKALVLAERITTVQEHLIFYRVGQTGNCQSTNSVAPFDFYEAFKELRTFLEKENLYEKLEQSFMNAALDGCIANLNVAEFGESHREIFERLKNEILDELSITGKDEDYFYPYNHENCNIERYKHVMECDYEGFLLYRAREFTKVYRDLLFSTYRYDQKLWKEIDDLKMERESLAHEVADLRQSVSYRLGHKIVKCVKTVCFWKR